MRKWKDSIITRGVSSGGVLAKHYTTRWNPDRFDFEGTPILFGETFPKLVPYELRAEPQQTFGEFELNPAYFARHVSHLVIDSLPTEALPELLVSLSRMLTYYGNLAIGSVTSHEEPIRMRVHSVEERPEFHVDLD